MRRLALIGALVTGLAVAIGAFGTHALGDLVSAERLDTFATGVRYQLIHGLALLALGLGRFDTPWIRRGGWLLLAGVLVFSLSLYLLVLTDTPLLGAVAPVGGALMLAGWGGVAWGIARAADPRPT
jgi:uncharacterized membrane protein YgdD (TMEM256/DUF423 family)